MKGLKAGGCPSQDDRLRLQSAEQGKFSIALNSASTRVGISTREFAKAMTEILRAETWTGRAMALAIASRSVKVLVTVGQFIERRLSCETTWLIQMYYRLWITDTDHFPPMVFDDDTHEYIELEVRTGSGKFTITADDGRHADLGHALIKAWLEATHQRCGCAECSHGTLPLIWQKIPDLFPLLAKYIGLL